MGKRFAIVIGVAAASAMALGAQTAAAAPDVVMYDTEVTINTGGHLLWGNVRSAVSTCGNDPSDQRGHRTGQRRVVLFKQRPGPDRKLRTTRSEGHEGFWSVGSIRRELQRGDRLYAEVRPEGHDKSVCRGDRSGTLVWRADRSETLGVGGLAATSTTGEPVDSVPPDLQLSGDKTQKAAWAGMICDRDNCNVLVEVSCGDEACMARTTGELTKVNEDKLTPDGGPPYGLVAPGEELRLGPELTKPSQRREVREALAEGKNVQAKVTVRAKDAAGNVATAHRTIKLVK